MYCFRCRKIHLDKDMQKQTQTEAKILRWDHRRGMLYLLLLNFLFVTALHVAFIAAETDASSTVNSDATPNSYKEARASIEVAGWQQSMDEEMENLRKLNC